MAGTIVAQFRDTAARRGDHPALRRRVGDRWEPLSWKDYARAVDEVGAGLTELGVQPGEAVGIFSWNRVEWPVTDLATMAVGGISVPVYPTNTARQAAYVLRHSGCRVCLVEDRTQLDKILAVRDELPKLDRVVLASGAVDEPDPFVVTFSGLRALGTDALARDPARVTRRSERVRPDDLATIVYTSGTTGPPKGAMLTHSNIAATVESLMRLIEERADDRFLSFLPLSHIAERVTSHFVQIAEGAETWFARSIATLAEDLPACRPTVFLGVPRVWQKFHDAIDDALAAETGTKGRLARRYVELGTTKARLARDGRRLPPRDAVTYDVLDRLVGTKLRARLGLDRTRLVVSSAAPIHASLVEFFHGIGLPIAEVYGQTEDCGPTTMNPPGRIRIGTVGRPLPGLSLRIGDDGEILVRGPAVCAGYFCDPTASAELLAGGWMHTGDLGVIDGEGYVTITGRKKDIIINAAGKNISPQELESRLRTEPLLSQAVVIGDGRPFLSALLTLDADALASWAGAHGRGTGVTGLVDDPDLLIDVRDCVERVNEEHAPVERIRRWRILDHDLSQEADELTPTLKVRRAAVIEKYADLVESMYRDG